MFGKHRPLSSRLRDGAGQPPAAGGPGARTGAHRAHGWLVFDPVCGPDHAARASALATSSRRQAAGDAARTAHRGRGASPSVPRVPALLGWKASAGEALGLGADDHRPHQVVQRPLHVLQVLDCKVKMTVVNPALSQADPIVLLRSYAELGYDHYDLVVIIGMQAYEKIRGESTAASHDAESAPPPTDGHICFPN
eukprot:m.271077 g.271077  ORF g.271077 m.271077 type:complete len:195 (+) comp22834_c1_seq14:598-1182(+)